jgi:uncharacterized membrane protein YesL
MAKTIRRMGIALGSLTMAWLALALVGGVIGLSPATGLLGALAVIVLGTLIYLDIVKREERPG